MGGLIDHIGIILTPVANPAKGDIPVRAETGGWTTVSAAGARHNSPLLLNSVTGQAEYGGGLVEKLPEPNEELRGRFIVMAGVGDQPDTVYVCIRDSYGYHWKQVV